MKKYRAASNIINTAVIMMIAAFALIITPRAHATALSFERGGVTWVSVAEFAASVGLRAARDTLSLKVTVTTERGAVTFAPDNAFYTLNDNAHVLENAPVNRGGALYLPRAQLANILGVRQAAVIPQPEGESIRTIVIDPGHGGRDPGAVGPGGTKEKDVVLAISLALRRLLVDAGFTVYMTRDADVFIPLRERTNFANERRADLFVSIHANAIAGDRRRRNSVRGYKIYFLSQAKNEEDRLSAMRENAVIEFEESDTRPNADMLQDVLTNIMGNEHLRESQELSIIMEQTFGARQNHIPRSQLGVGQANFWVLNGAFMPAVLVEVGFISNETEERLLASPNVQSQLAAALSESLIAFKKMFDEQ